MRGAPAQIAGRHPDRRLLRGLDDANLLGHRYRDELIERDASAFASRVTAALNRCRQFQWVRCPAHDPNSFSSFRGSTLL
jgi:hypothetical protein